MKTNNSINNNLFIIGTVVLIVIVVLEILYAYNTFILKLNSTNTPSPTTITPKSSELIFFNKKDKSVDVLGLDGNKVRTIYKPEGTVNLIGARYCSSKNKLGIIERSVVGSVVTTTLNVVDLNNNSKKNIDIKSYNSSNKNIFSEIGFIDSFSPNCDYMVYSIAQNTGCSTGIYSFLTDQIISSTYCHNLFWSPTSDYLFNITPNAPGFFQLKFGFINKSNLAAQFNNSKNLEIASLDISKIAPKWPQNMQVFPAGFFTDSDRIVLFPFGSDAVTVASTDPVVLNFVTNETEEYFGASRPRGDVGVLNFINKDQVFIDTSRVAIGEQLEDFIYEYSANWREQSDPVKTNIHSFDYIFAGWAQ